MEHKKYPKFTTGPFSGPFSFGDNGKKLDKIRKQLLFQEELGRIQDREKKYQDRKGVL